MMGRCLTQGRASATETEAAHALPVELSVVVVLLLLLLLLLLRRDPKPEPCHPKAESSGARPQCRCVFGVQAPLEWREFVVR